MGKWHWGKAAKEIAAENGVKYKKFEAILTSPTASCLDLGKGIYSYREGGLYAVVNFGEAGDSICWNRHERRGS